MNGATIIKLLSSNPTSQHLFKGFLTPDTSIKLHNFPAIVIINTDKQTGPGKHWCVAFYVNKNLCEYFDPLGFPPKNETSGYDLTPKLFENCKKHVYFNKKQVQNIDAITCGHHCIYFCFLRSKNISMTNILKLHYSNDTDKNDKVVEKFIEQCLNTTFI